MDVKQSASAVVQQDSSVKNIDKKAGSEEYSCTICYKECSNLQECLKHEIVEHNTNTQRPYKSLLGRLNMILKDLRDEDNKHLRARLHDELNKCEKGEELNRIFKIHCMNSENLKMVYNRIHMCLLKELQAIGPLQIFPFGSIGNGLALRDSDVDFYMECSNINNDKSPQFRITFNRICSLLYRSECFVDVIPIRHARVPIIKCKHNHTGFSLDINICCPSSVENTNFIRDLNRFDKRIHESVLYLKIWAKQLQLIGRGNMTSYCLIILVLFYLQQSHSGGDFPMIPSIRKLQDRIPPRMVLGVNYAYDLKAHMKHISEDINTFELIKGFFAFYKDFEFEQSIVAPYLGDIIMRDKFKSGEFWYTAYENQLRATTILNARISEPLNIDRCMCIQDPFCLNHNVAKSITPTSFEYFRKCLQCAHQICTDSKLTSIGDIYEALMYTVIDKINQIVRPVDHTDGISQTLNKSAELNFRFTPRRIELRALALYTNCSNENELHVLWVNSYIESIVDIITLVYRLDAQRISPTHDSKHKRLENSDLSKVWFINGSVDMWTGRQHQRTNSQSFMAYQLAQTEAFHHERRQNSSYAVQLSGILTINIICNHKALEVTVSPRDDTMVICKKNPFRKFFAMFKCSMQNFNLKEKFPTPSTKVEESKTT